METDESMRCPKCKRIAVELISPNDKNLKYARDVRGKMNIERDKINFGFIRKSNDGQVLFWTRGVGMDLLDLLKTICLMIKVKLFCKK